MRGLLGKRFGIRKLSKQLEEEIHRRNQVAFHCVANAQAVHRLHTYPVWNIGLLEQLLVNADGTVVMAQDLFPPRTLFQGQLQRQRRRPGLE